MLRPRQMPRPFNRFIPVGIDDVRLPSDPPWLIRGILPARGLACIVGAPKSGKSFLTTDMLCAVARGVPYAGRDTTAGGQVPDGGGRRQWLQTPTRRYAPALFDHW